MPFFCNGVRRCFLLVQDDPLSIPPALSTACSRPESFFFPFRDKEIFFRTLAQEAPEKEHLLFVRQMSLSNEVIEWSFPLQNIMMMRVP